MKLYYVTSSSEAYTRALNERGLYNQLRSFYFLKTPKSRQLINRDYDLIDSGGFSARINGAVIDVAEYANFLNTYKIKLAFNLDTKDEQETIDNQFYLDSNCPDTYIIPVYHVSDYVREEYRPLLEYYMYLGYKYIGIGGVAGAKNNKEQESRFYNLVFNRTGNEIRLHGLGITSEKILRNYPWYSCDSSSFLAPAQFASMKTQSDEMSKVMARTKHYVDRVMTDISYWVGLQDRMTRLWEKRGFVWQEANIEELISTRNQIQLNNKLSYEEWKQANGF